MKWIYEPWPWYISGPMISLIMLLLIMMNKNFGMSSNLKTLCTICGADKMSHFFKFNWKTNRWNLIIALGTIIGGFVGSHFMTTNASVAITPETIVQLKALGFESAGKAYLPSKLFNSNFYTSSKNLAILAIGGLLVGFGARYAGGCTSGHAISGLSNLQIPSLIAVIGFFIGGLVMTHLLFPLIF